MKQILFFISIAITTVGVTCVSCKKSGTPSSKQAAPVGGALAFRTVGRGVLQIKAAPLKRASPLVIINSRDGYNRFLKSVYKYVAKPVPPAVPSKDPILGRPIIDFTKEMMIVVRRYSANCPPEVTSVFAHEPKGVQVTARYKEPCFKHFSMTDKWSYVAVIVQKHPGNVSLKKVK